MFAKKFELGRVIAGKLEYQSDLLGSINEICIENEIKAGFISIIGAISSLKLGYFKQDEKKYINLDAIETTHPLEICSCTGNVSIKEGKPVAHLHIVASGKDGKCMGGHLMPDTIIYAAEFYIQEIIGDELIRELDSTTMLPLWRK